MSFTSAWLSKLIPCGDCHHRADVAEAVLLAPEVYREV
jgi:hypothetical protein